MVFVVTGTGRVA